MAGPNRSLVIVDGSVAGLLASAVGSERGRPRGEVVDWMPGGLDGERARAVQRQAELLQIEAVIGAVSENSRSPGEAEVRMLLDAAYACVVRGLDSVVWPVTAGRTEPDLDRISHAADRALLAAHLVSVGLDRPIKIETPYVDLTDRQLADLILDMDLPIWLCWWADSATPQAATEREHWQAMLRAAGWEGPLPGPDLSVSVRPTPMPDAPRAHR